MFAMNEGVKTGPVVSTTVMLNEAAPVFVCASVELHVVNVVPIGKIEPDGGTQETAGVPSTASVALDT